MRFRPAALLLSIALASLAGGGTTLVVDLGGHPSPEAAAYSESQVNWLDGDASDDTRCTQAFAALELQWFLREATSRGSDFAIVDDNAGPPPGELILVGGSESNALTRLLKLGVGLSKLGAQAYRLRTATVDGRRVLLVAGGSRVGTLYGAYDLLHRLGCRWFAPGDMHAHVPRVERIPDLDVTESPDFVTRGFHAWENRAPEAFLLWMARNRLNYWCVEQSGHPLLHKLGFQLAGGSHDAQSLFLNPHAPHDAGTLFDAHPEWFPVKDGRRVPGVKQDEPDHGVNFCTTNADAVKQYVAGFVQAAIDGRYRGASIIRVWTLDGGEWCECKPCREAGSPTDRTLRLVHAVAQGLTAARKDGRLTRPVAVRSLAYGEAVSPPTRPLPDGFDTTTCTMTFFPNGRSYVRPLHAEGSATNAPLYRALLGWAADEGRHYRGGLCIGEYYNVSKFNGLPLVLTRVMAADIPRFHKLGARHFHYMHVTTGPWGTKALTNYQMARQLWDADTDCESLRADYFARRYGPAAEPMRKVYESLEKALANATELRYTFARALDRARNTRPLFPNPQLRYRREPGVECDGPTLVEMVGHIRAGREHMDQALTMEVPKRLRRILAEDDKLFRYAENTLLYYDACAQGFALAWAGKTEEARPRYAEALRVARLLEADTDSARHTAGYLNVANGFLGTRAPRALGRLRELLGPTR